MFVYYHAHFFKNLPGLQGKFWFREVNVVGVVVKTRIETDIPLSFPLSGLSAQ